MKYFKDLDKLLSRAEARQKQGMRIPVEEAILKISRLAVEADKKGNKSIFIGNGGSASISSHMATDFLKNAGLCAQAFNDPSLLTCLSNDLGYEYVFEKPIEIMGKKGDILFSISSSGASKNILNATRLAREKKLHVITFSGFSEDNPLRILGDINFYLPSRSYGYVEIGHLAICHAIVDTIIANKR